jgi:hypothetical protein
MEIRRLLGASVHAAWSETTELTWSGGRVSLEVGERIVQFALYQKSGMPEFLSLVRTIIVRSQLQFVGGKVGVLLYRRFDA